MNKKFLSAILFGALMVTSTGTFVSCKDYDEDIENLQGQINANASAITALQSKVDAGNYVTGVTKTAEGITFTFSNGSPVLVELQAQAGKDGSIAEVKNGILYINGEATEISASAVKVENGMWVALQADGTYASTGIPASGVTAVKNEDKTWTLTVYNAAGEEQVIKLPSAASMLTEIDPMGYLYASANKKYSTNDGTIYAPFAERTSGGTIIWYDFHIVSEAQTTSDAAKAWNAEAVTKKFVKGQAMSSIAPYQGELALRIAPATLDASDLSFSFVDTKMNEVPVEFGTPEAYTGLLTRSSNGNGLWTVPITATEGVTYNNAAAYKAQFEVVDEKSGDTRYKAFAIKEEGGFVSEFDIEFRHDDFGMSTTPNGCTAVVNEEANITFNPIVWSTYSGTEWEFIPVYDAHLHFNEADVIRWGIVYSGNGTAFTVTKLNDELTIPSITVNVHYVTLDGEVHTTPVRVYIAKSTDEVTLAAGHILINADDAKNKFSTSLAPMFESLGSDNTVLWRNDINRHDATLWREGVAADGEVGDFEVTGTGVTIEFDKAYAEANNAIVKLNGAVLNRFYNYYFLVNFYRKSDGRLVNTIKVPFTISIPALTDLLKGEQVVFNGTANGIGVMNEYDLAADLGAATYSLKYAFTNKLADAFANNTAITFAVAGNQAIKIDGNNVNVAANLVKVTNGDNKDVKLELLNYGNHMTPMYNTAINMVISSASYLNKYAYTKDERAAAAFTMTIVSPIEQGTLTPAAGANATISVVATEDGIARVSESDLAAKTYAGIAYNVFKDTAFTNGVATAWTSPYIKTDPIFESTNTNVFTVGNVKAASKDADGNVTKGYVEIKPMNVAYEDAVPVKVTVTDAWGYKKVVTINVKVLPKK